ncbi:helix-turn-helix domain-containing protein [Termitidicoccus mucosus]
MAGDRSQSPVFPVDYFEHTGASLTFLLIDALAHEKESKAAPATLDAEQLRRILDHIDKNLDDKIEAGTLAGVARLSVTHFKRLFKATTGMTAGDYISRERIHKAQALLRQGDMTVADVAACCGFCDQGYMDRCFRRFCRCSPRDFLPKGRIVRKNGPDVQAKPGKTGHNGGTF